MKKNQIKLNKTHVLHLLPSAFQITESGQTCFHERINGEVCHVIVPESADAEQEFILIDDESVISVRIDDFENCYVDGDLVTPQEPSELILDDSNVDEYYSVLGV